MTTDLKKDIKATKNQAEKMQRMTADLKKDIMEMEMWAMKVNQTVQGRVKLISKRKELKLLPNWSVTLFGNHIHLEETVSLMQWPLTI